MEKVNSYSEYGMNPFDQWDYIVVPKGTTYQMKFDDFKNVKLFIIESDTPFDIPRHFRNEYGQLKEDAPYYERDFKPPQFSEPVDKLGKFDLISQSFKQNF